MITACMITTFIYVRLKSSTVLKPVYPVVRWLERDDVQATERKAYYTGTGR